MINGSRLKEAFRYRFIGRLIFKRIQQLRWSPNTRLNSRQVFPPVLVKVFTAKMLEFVQKLCRAQLLRVEVFIYQKCYMKKIFNKFNIFIESACSVFIDEYCFKTGAAWLVSSPPDRAIRFKSWPGTLRGVLEQDAFLDLIVSLLTPVHR